MDKVLREIINPWHYLKLNLENDSKGKGCSLNKLEGRAGSQWLCTFSGCEEKKETPTISASEIHAYLTCLK